MKLICRGHMTQLNKVATKLAYKLTMNGTQMLLSEKNKILVEKAEEKIYDAIQLLRKVI